MKRRTFIQLVGASALGLPFMYSQLGSRRRKAKSAPAPDRERRALRLELPPDQAAVLSVLRRHSQGVYIVGGGVLGQAAGTDLPYLNLLADSQAFPRIKTSLFEFGVSPISTPELPGNFIRFVHQDRAYSVLNLERDTFLQNNIYDQKLSLIPLAHNFLLYSADESWVIDPYHALEERGPRNAGFRIKLLSLPDTPATGLECCLAVAFDAALLGLALPTEHAALEEQVLNAKAAKPEVPLVIHQIVNYFPDLIEVRGYAVVKKYLLSPLCRSAAAAGPGLDLEQVGARLEARRKAGHQITGVALLTAINREFCRVQRNPVFGLGFTDYMAAKRLPMRRRDLWAQVLADRGGGVTA